MHRSVLNGFLILAVSSVALADGVTRNETIVISKISQSGDFMPPTTRTTPQSKIRFRATSNGCAQSADFKVVVDHQKTGEFLSIVRVRPDNCKKGDSIEEFEITTDQLAHSTRMWDASGEAIVNPIYSANPIAVEDQTTH